jgi:antitoxin FitA
VGDGNLTLWVGTTFVLRAAVDMLNACFYHFRMSTMIQIRNVPQALHRRLKSRAALEGKSLSDYLLDEIREAAERPTLAEMRARLETREAVSPSPEPALAVRDERDRA